MSVYIPRMSIPSRIEIADYLPKQNPSALAQLVMAYQQLLPDKTKDFLWNKVKGWGDALTSETPETESWEPSSEISADLVGTEGEAMSEDGSRPIGRFEQRVADAERAMPQRVRNEASRRVGRSGMQQPVDPFLLAMQEYEVPELRGSI